MAMATNTSGKTKNESGSGSEKENNGKASSADGLEGNNKTPKKVKRKILASSDDDEDPDFSLKPKAAKKSEKIESKSSSGSNAKVVASSNNSSSKHHQQSLSQKPPSTKTSTSATSTASSVVKNLDNSPETIKKILSGEKITEREKLFPRYCNSDGGNDRTIEKHRQNHNSTSSSKSSSPIKSKESADKSKLAAAPGVTPDLGVSKDAKSKIERKIEVSTPTGGNFDLLGSIMKDMRKWEWTAKKEREQYMTRLRHPPTCVSLKKSERESIDNSIVGINTSITTRPERKP